MGYLEIPWRPEEAGGELICVVEKDFDLSPWGVKGVVPAGFRSDGMSVPRFLWGSIGPRVAARTIGPSIVHDWLYSTHVMSRAAADKWYRRALVANGYPRLRAWEVWLGVRIGGKSHW